MLVKIGKVFAGIAAVLAVLWVVGPYEPAPLTPNIDTSQIVGNVDAYLAAREAEFDDITPGVEKQVVWADAAGVRSDWVVLYVHGFSATSEEIRPVPDKIAEGLRANMVFTRLRGHGRDGAAMAEATVQDWMNDLSEALAVSRAVGDKILVVSTSTGGTLVAAAAQDPAMMQGVIGSAFVSPNFAVNNPAAPLLTWPAAELWLPLLVGADRSFEPLNEGQAKYWTTAYPSKAVFPMAAVVAAVAKLDHSASTLPALFVFSEDDKVVVPSATRDVMAAWGGPTKMYQPSLTDADDPFAHVIAGDIMSPAQTDSTAAEILNWAKGLD